MYNIYDCEIDNQYLLKDQVIEYIRNAKEAVKTEEATNILERLEAAISLLPGADVAPVVHGEWLNTDGDYTSAACSICKTEYEVATEEEAEKGLWDAFMCSYRYCPNCGAKMDGAEQRDNE